MGADEVVKKVLLELSKKENVPIPTVVWLDREGMEAGEYLTEEKEILLDNRLKKYYYLNENIAEMILKYLAAHEFYHYLEDIRKIHGTYYQREFAASDYAKTATGIGMYTYSIYTKNFERLLRESRR